jgi:APA family basic amino acid/polyamine antiporter
MSTPSPAPSPATQHPAELKRSLSQRDLIFIVVGTTIGSGIFLTPARVLGEAGSGGVALTVWVVGGVLSLLGALTFAELGAANPKAGGLYVYLREAFGPASAFLFGWTMFLVIGSGSLATLAAAFPRYVEFFIPLGPIGHYAVSLLVIAVVAVLNVRGTRGSANVQGVTTAAKVAVIVGLAAALVFASPDKLAAQTWWPATVSFSTFTGAITAMIGILWAYEGWQYATFSAGEMVDPQRTFGRGIVIGTALLIGIYVLTNVGYVAALGLDGVAASPRVASDAAAAVFGPWAGAAISVVILVSIFSASNGLVLTLPRVFYAMAADGLFFRQLAAVHPKFGTPAAAVIATAAWSGVLVLSGTFEQLLTYVVFMSWVWFALAALAIFALRRKHPDMRRPFKTPGYPVTPILFVASAAIIVINTVVAKPVQSAIGLGITLAGIPAYLWWRARADVKY